MTDAVPISQPLVRHHHQPGFNMLASAPGPLVRAGDSLQLNATTTDATGVLTCNGRLLTLDGAVVPFNLSLTFSGTGNQTSVAVPLADGWIIGFDVFVSSGTITDGEVVASVEVVQGTGTPATRVMCLASGEVTNIRNLGLGAFLVRGPAAASGETPTFNFATLADPAVATDWVITVPVGQTWEFVSLRAQFAPAGAGRVPLFVMDDGTNIYASSPLNADIGGGTKVFGLFQGAGLAAATSTGNMAAPIPKVRMPAGHRFRASTFAIAGADQWSGIAYTYITYA